MSLSIFLRQLILMSLYSWVRFSYLDQDFFVCFIIFSGEVSCLRGCFQSCMSPHTGQCHRCLCQTVLGFHEQSLCEELGTLFRYRSSSHHVFMCHRLSSQSYGSIQCPSIGQATLGVQFHLPLNMGRKFNSRGWFHEGSQVLLSNHLRNLFSLYQHRTLKPYPQCLFPIMASYNLSASASVLAHGQSAFVFNTGRHSL